MSAVAPGLVGPTVSRCLSQVNHLSIKMHDLAAERAVVHKPINK